MDNEKFSVKKRLYSFAYACKGIKLAFGKQHNFRIHCFAALLVLILSLLCRITATEWCLVIAVSGFVICAEIFNTAVEYLVDKISPEHNVSAGMIKDLAAGAVLVSAITAAITGFIIFIPRLMSLFY
ncbi:MAG: diacylglycerol kinase family protein [Bacteroidia bacterium]|nr:diacylglycerol kinase family protein [Bacteroidia bacterium]